MELLLSLFIELYVSWLLSSRNFLLETLEKTFEIVYSEVVSFRIGFLWDDLLQDDVSSRTNHKIIEMPPQHQHVPNLISRTFLFWILRKNIEECFFQGDVSLPIRGHMYLPVVYHLCKDAMCHSLSGATCHTFFTHLATQKFWICMSHVTLLLGHAIVTSSCHYVSYVISTSQ